MRRSHFVPQFRFSRTIGVVRLDAQNRILGINDALLKILRCSREELLRHGFFDLLSDSKKIAARANKALHQQHQWQGRAQLKPVISKPFAPGPTLHILMHRLGNDTDETIATVVMLDHITPVIDALIKRSHLDSLTGLFNRKLLMRELERLLPSSTLFKPLSVLYLDIDNFKHINDCFGHNTGDLVLKEVSHRIQKVIFTQCRSPFEFVMPSRIGGDEFCLLFNGPFTYGQMVNLAKKFSCELQFDLPHESSVLSIRCSMGLAFAPSDADNAADLLEKADQAMYEAKNLSTHLSLAGMASASSYVQIPLAL